MRTKRKTDARSNIIGKNFDGITVLEETNKIKWNAIVFTALCRCGEKFEEVGYILKKGFGCGCKINLFGRITDEKDFSRYTKTKYGIYKNGATRRNISFELSLEQFRSIITENCFYCDSPPVESTLNKGKTYKYTGISNGIDRKDNDKGYVMDNCVPCCTTCNMMKKTLNFNKFIEHCQKIASVIKK